MHTAQQAQGAWVQPSELRRRLLDASSQGVGACAVALPPAELLQIARAAKAILLKEKTLLEVWGAARFCQRLAASHLRGQAAG